MQIAMGVWNGAEKIVGRRNGSWIDLHSGDPSLPSNLDALIRSVGSELANRLKQGLDSGWVLALPPQRWLPPLQEPSKILCVGKNYADHAREMQGEIPTEPVIFNKLRSTLTGHESNIVLPKQSCQVDYEAELVVVVGKGGRNISLENAYEHVAGYCCGNDVSARDWQLQKPSGQWLLGKSFDTFAPLGPWLVTADEIPDSSQLKIELRLNGQILQSSHTGNLIYPIPVLIAYVSQVCTLLPGDLLFTGTPSGVGMARSPQVFLKAGDLVEVELERIGILRNSVVGPCP